MQDKKNKFKLVALARSFAKCSQKPLEYLEDSGIEVIVKRNHDVNNEEKVAELIGDADAVIVGSDKIGQIVFDACRNLKVISKHGVGLDSIDLENAKRRGIIVTNTPGANHESVADLTWLLIMTASRDFLGISEYVKRMDWHYPNMGNEVIGKTIGIIGYGRIGKSVAKRASGFDNRVLVFDPMVEKIEPINDLDIKKVSLDALLRESDIITLHAPLTEKTQLMINEQAISNVKQGAIIVNTSRGELIDEKALYNALLSGKIKAAALDVFTKEPPVGNPLLTLKNVIATPHIGTHTEESNIRMGMAAAENAVSALNGQACIALNC
ncbi:MAG: Glyoxylate reductase [Clostridia bacterium]|jgi:D-3-phosphoglycerate dehydrogenase|nr:Glyoxylate reductase [Clostridia bacterium]